MQLFSNFEEFKLKIHILHVFSTACYLFVLISLQKFHATKVGRPPLSGGTKWPLTGGVPSEMSLSKEQLIERMYIAGYKDGSVRIWDSTFPILELMFVLNGKVSTTELYTDFI